jgi:transaldolase
MPIEIYYDGIHIEKYHNHKDVVGFTTNISFMKEGGITDYKKFIEESIKYINNRPISFQVYEEENNKMEEMVKKIYDIAGEENKNLVFVKIPVVKTNGESNVEMIKKLHEEGFNVNVTCVYTNEQLESLKGVFNKETPTIVSIFAGKINDTGRDCTDIVKYSKTLFSSNVKILWAACRTVYNIIESENQEADIVTVPGKVLDKLTSDLNKDLNEQCLKVAKNFIDDSKDMFI